MYHRSPSSDLDRARKERRLQDWVSRYAHLAPSELSSTTHHPRPQAFWNHLNTDFGRESPLTIPHPCLYGCGCCSSTISESWRDIDTLRSAASVHLYALRDPTKNLLQPTLIHQRLIPYLCSTKVVNMVRSQRNVVEANETASASSSSSSPERAAYDDDTDFFTAQRNDSESSIGVSSLRDLTMSPSQEREHRVSPISRLPPELLIGVFTKLNSSADLRSCMLVSKTWSRNSVDLLWHRPLCNTWHNLQSVTRSIQTTDGYYSYNALVKRLNLSNLNDQISDGTVNPFQMCKRIERLTLTGCVKLTDGGVCSLIYGSRSLLALDITGLDAITDHTLKAVSENCGRLQGLNITDCSKVTDDSLVAVAENCHLLKRVSLATSKG